MSHATDSELRTFLREMLIGPQIRMARAALGWTVADLSKASGISPSAIMRAETASGVPVMKAPNLFKLQRTLEVGGIVFIDATETVGAGVRFKQPLPGMAG